MTGNKPQGLVVQERDRKLLSELAVMRFLDREQAKRVAGFGSTTRANTRLLALVRAGLLKRFFTGTLAGGHKAVYALSRKGAELAGLRFQPTGGKGDHVLIADPFFEHRQQINRVYLAVKYAPIPGGRFRRWAGFRQSLSSRARLIPDGYFEIDTPGGILPMFLEVDRGTEPLSRWKSKVAGYLELAVGGEFQRLFGRQRFRVLVIAPSDRRLKTVRATVLAATEKVFWFSTFARIEREGLWSAIWTRPRGDDLEQLIHRQTCVTATTAAA